MRFLPIVFSALHVGSVAPPFQAEPRMLQPGGKDACHLNLLGLFACASSNKPC